MLYLGIDQHRKQLTVNLRNEAGDIVLRRQVSTEWERVRTFFGELRGLAEAEGGFVAILWHMLKNKEPYVAGGPPRRKLTAAAT